MYLCMQMHLQVGVWQDAACTAAASGARRAALQGRHNMQCSQSCAHSGWPPICRSNCLPCPAMQAGEVASSVGEGARHVVSWAGFDSASVNHPLPVRQMMRLGQNALVLLRSFAGWPMPTAAVVVCLADLAFLLSTGGGDQGEAAGGACGARR